MNSPFVNNRIYIKCFQSHKESKREVAAQIKLGRLNQYPALVTPLKVKLWALDF